MKVTPSQIEFTLPSPKLGLESSQVIDAPWEPKMKTKVSNAMHDRGQVREGKIFSLRIISGYLICVMSISVGFILS